MKIKNTIAVLIALGAISASSFVSAQSGPSMQQDTSSQTQPQAMPEDPSAQGDSESSLNVQGTASSVDQDSNMLTVKDSASGSDRTFRVSQEDQLEGVKPGDQVNVTPSPDDPTRAENVQKQ